MLVSICAYGRAASARSCARRSRAAETIFMALVICRVLRTLRMRRRISKTFAIGASSIYEVRFAKRSAVARLQLNFQLRTSSFLLPSCCHLALTHEALFEIGNELGHLGFQVVIERLLLFDLLQSPGAHCVHVLVEFA